MSAQIPEDFDPAEFPIIATHFLGIEVRDVREVYWSLARALHGLGLAAGADVGRPVDVLRRLEAGR